MNVIFTCGGSGGHINPAIAVANMWKEKHPESKIIFIGAKGGMEERLVPQAGFELKTLPGGGLSRRLTPRGIKNNIQVVYNLLDAINKSKKIIKEFGASVVVGTGGYASFPALMAAGMLKVPCCVHESNAYPGLTTRMIERWANRIMVCFPQSAQYYKDKSKVSVVGMPVRSEFIYNNKQECRKELGLDERPVILSAFGSNGAMIMNEMTAELMRMEKDAGYPFQHIHAAGSFGWRWLPDLVADKGVDVEASGSIHMQEYLYNMPAAMTAADIVISRAGSSSLNEIAVSGKPCILVPSPNVTANHQEKNARALEAQGAAAVILEKDCTPYAVMDIIQNLLQNPEAYNKMRKALLDIAIPNSAERICEIMEELTSGKTKE